MADAQIAAICRTHGALIATRNTRDFEFQALTSSTPGTLEGGFIHNARIPSEPGVVHDQTLKWLTIICN